MRLINTFPKAYQHRLELDLSSPQQCILTVIAQHCEKFDTGMNCGLSTGSRLCPGIRL